MLDRPTQGRFEVLARIHANPHRPALAGVGGEGRVHQGRLPHVPMPRALLLADLAQLAVVEDDVGHVHPVLHQGGEVRQVLPQAAVPGHRDDLAAREPGVAPLRGRPGADRGGQREPDGSEVAGHQDGLPSALEVSTRFDSGS